MDNAPILHLISSGETVMMNAVTTLCLFRPARFQSLMR